MDLVDALKGWLDEWGVPYEKVEVHPERGIVQAFLKDGRLTEFPPAWVREGKVDLMRTVLRHYIAAEAPPGPSEVELSRPARIQEG